MQLSKGWAQHLAPEWLTFAASSHGEAFYSTTAYKHQANMIGSFLETFKAGHDGHAVLYDAHGRGTFKYLRDRQNEEAKRKRQEAVAAAEQTRLEEEQAKTDSRRKSRAREPTPELATPPSKHAPSPTINTKAAMAEVNDMFGSTMAFEMSPKSAKSTGSSTEEEATLEEGDSRTEDDAESSADEAPIVSQASQPGDFVNDSFWGPVQSQASQFSQPSQSQPRNPRSRLLDEEDEDDEETPPAHAPHTALKSSSLAPAKRLFTVPSDGPSDSLSSSDSHGNAASERGALAPVSPAANPTLAPSDAPGTGADLASAVSEPFQVFQDENSEKPQMQHPTALDLGRRPLASRFAPMVDLMTPIVERTLEYGNQTQTGALTGDMRGARQLVEDSETEDDGVDASAFFDAENFQQQRRRKISAASTLADVHEEGSDATYEEDEELADILQSNAKMNDAQPDQKAICPFSPEWAMQATSQMRPISSLSGYHPLSSQTSHRLAALQRDAKTKRRVSGDNGVHLELDSIELSVREKLGEGGFGAVFRVAATQEVEGRPSVFALKSQSPPVTWEFQHILQLRSRLCGNERALSSIVQPYDLFHFSDESHLLLEVCDQGTLLDMVNVAPKSGFGVMGGALGLDELLAMFFTVELMRTMEACHQADMLHGDLKIDNCLVRLEEVPGGPKAWSTAYKSDGSEGWARKGIKLIDFGRSVDLHAYSPGQRFVADWNADTKDCLEVRQGQAWTFEPDYYGLAGICFTLLFGKHFESDHVVASKSGHGSVLAGKPFRRYHQVDLWTRFFGLLLDPRAVKPTQQLPITEELSVLRKDMEVWLEANAGKAGKNLKALLKKVEIAQLSRGR